jgi:hypothetical protein
MIYGSNTEFEWLWMREEAVVTCLYYYNSIHEEQFWKTIEYRYDGNG